MTTPANPPQAVPSRSKFASRHAQPEQWALFLSCLGKGWAVTRAAHVAGVSKQAAFKRRRRDHEFASAWHTAQCIGVDNKRDQLFGAALELADRNVRDSKWRRLETKLQENIEIREQLDLEVELVWQPFYAKLKELRRTFTPPSVSGSRPQNFLTGRRHSEPERLPRQATPQGRLLADTVVEQTGVRPNSPEGLRRSAREGIPPCKGRAGLLF